MSHVCYLRELFPLVQYKRSRIASVAGSKLVHRSWIHNTYKYLYIRRYIEMCINYVLIIISKLSVSIST